MFMNIPVHEYQTSDIPNFPSDSIPMMMMMMNAYLRYKHRSVIGVLYYSTVDSLPEDR